MPEVVAHSIWVCSTCLEAKPVEEFSLDRSRTTGRSPVCKSCRSAWARAYRRTSPEAIHATDLKRRYDLSLELEAQDGRCRICRTDKPKGHGGKRFAVDHDHETGKVRGLLCADCNNGLARFKDDPAFLAAAILYLESQ